MARHFSYFAQVRMMVSLNSQIVEGQARAVVEGTKDLAGGMDRKVHLKDMRERVKERDRPRQKE